MNKRSFFIFFTITLFTLISANSYGVTILIDPGHGGSDHGAIGNLKLKTRKGSWTTVEIPEKELALSISKLIYENLKGKYQVFLTRSLDRDVTLAQRSDLAEKVKADLFISVHINSSQASHSNGVETYYLDNSEDVAVNKVESVENQSFASEKDQAINHILTDLVIQQTVSFSKRLAYKIHGNIQKKVIKKFNRVDRGVKAGMFFVLALSKRPGVLLEAGFISNQEELYKMRTKSFQVRYAKAVAKGV